MKIRPGYVLRQVMDIHVVLGVGSEAYTPNQIMSLNGTGAFLWHLLEQGADARDLTDALTREYDTDARTAAADVDRFLAQLREKELITE